jgi:hypothetical protein
VLHICSLRGSACCLPVFLRVAAALLRQREAIQHQHASELQSRHVYTCAQPRSDIAIRSAQLLQVLEDRQRPYSLDVIGTTFTDGSYTALLLALLSHEAPAAISLRGCACDMPRWKRQEAYILLSHHLSRDGAQRRFVGDETPVELWAGGGAGGAGWESGAGSKRERAEFAQMLLDEWLVPMKAHCHSSSACTRSWVVVDSRFSQACAAILGELCK